MASGTGGAQGSQSPGSEVKVQQGQWPGLPDASSHTQLLWPRRERLSTRRLGLRRPPGQQAALPTAGPWPSPHPPRPFHVGHRKPSSGSEGQDGWRQPADPGGCGGAPQVEAGLARGRASQKPRIHGAGPSRCFPSPCCSCLSSKRSRGRPRRPNNPTRKLHTLAQAKARSPVLLTPLLTTASPAGAAGLSSCQTWCHGARHAGGGPGCRALQPGLAGFLPRGRGRLCANTPTGLPPSVFRFI